MIIRHSPKKGVGSIVIDFALRVSPVQTLPGGLLHHTGFHRCALIRTARFEWAVADLFGDGSGCGALAGGVDRGHAASLRLRFGHGFTDHPPSALSMIAYGLAYLWARLLYTTIRVSPTPVTDSILGWSEKTNVTSGTNAQREKKKPENHVLLMSATQHRIDMHVEAGLL